MIHQLGQEIQKENNENADGANQKTCQGPLGLMDIKIPAKHTTVFVGILFLGVLREGFGAHHI